MRAILVRIGIDHSYGHWNAPVDPTSREFVYVPIPDAGDKQYRPGCRRTFREVVPVLQKFSETFGIKRMDFPRDLLGKAMHLDPDFSTLTYGDNARRRGSGIKELSRGDLLVFYAGLRSITRKGRLIYALVGVYTVGRVIRAVDVSARRWCDNAHTRWTRINADDIVVRASLVRSGRFGRCLPIGEWRNRAYRVKTHIFRAWGGLSVMDGYIQRSATPPEFLRPERFLRWLGNQDFEFFWRNNWHESTEGIHRGPSPTQT
jgi:hypothetical protein